MAKVPHEKGSLAKLSGAVTAAGGQFAAFGLHPDSETVTFKVQGVDREKLLEAIKPLVVEFLDVRVS